jgi:hypothetical protein
VAEEKPILSWSELHYKLFMDLLRRHGLIK